MKFLRFPPGYLRGAMLLGGLLAGLVLFQLWSRAFINGTEKEAAFVYSSNQALMVMASGQVLNPGIYELAPGSIIKDLMSRAGPSFDLNLIPENIQQLSLTTGQEVFFSKELPNGLQLKPLNGRARMVLFIPIDINIASLDDLEALPRIGKETAKQIVRYRELYGPFASVNDLTQVSGLGPKTLEKVRELVRADSGPGRKP